MNNNRIYLLTGAAGFLGSNICTQLLSEGKQVRALVLPNDKSVTYIPKEVEVVIGDLCDEASLEPFFTVPEGFTSVLIHCASMVTVDPTFSEKLMAVNVGGTRNIITKVLAHPECEKMVYVSSTGAIPEQPHGTPIAEVDRFTPCDPEKVVGAYSMSKAIATQMVLDSVKVMGLRACVVHPSGILGPNDHAIGEITGTVLQIIKGEMPMGIQGSFNLCDVRDLAAGTIAAVNQGRIGECYILANEPVTLKEMFEMINAECASKKIKFYLPLNLANKIARGLEKQAEKAGKKPLMTTFSVYNLARNNVFDYSKARRELGYTTRPYQETIRDMIQWMKDERLLDSDSPSEGMSPKDLSDSGIIPTVAHSSAACEMAKDAYQAIEGGVVGAYKTVEKGAVDAYKAVEKGAVDAYHKVEDTMVDKLFRREGETVEQARNRLRR